MAPNFDAVLFFHPTVGVLSPAHPARLPSASHGRHDCVLQQKASHQALAHDKVLLPHAPCHRCTPIHYDKERYQTAGQRYLTRHENLRVQTGHLFH